ncbi:MAG: hypothetical protein WCH00_03275, partial [Candidatus Saccharibacteria bacterium]
AKIIANGTPTTPFSIKGDPPIDNNVINTELQANMRELSRRKYGRPKAEVDQEIISSLSTTSPEENQESVVPT